MLIRENVPEARKLNRRVKMRWCLEKGSALIPLVAGTYALLYLLTYSDPGGLMPVHYGIVAAVAVLGAGAVYAYSEVKYRKFVYALREKDFLIQKGVVEKIRYVIPYEKIQNVTVSRDILDQALGLGTLHVETAAHVIVENDIILPGISNEENLVSELVERSREAKEAGKDAPASMLGVMKDVLAELRGIRTVLAAEVPQAHDSARDDEPISAELKRTKVLYDKGLPRRKSDKR